jgi:FtsP/CotA-like multicopper oxidase with cupredoxin domain
MQVPERYGMEQLPAEDMGWKDTVLVAPGETVRVLIRYHDYWGDYVHHCHNREHEDKGMMQNLRMLHHHALRKLDDRDES